MTIPHVTLFYFDLKSNSTGQVIHLLLKDCGVPHEYKHVIFVPEEWIIMKKDILREQNHFGTLPQIDMDGKRYVGTLPILRVLSKKLDLHGENEDQEHFVDTAADICMDWNRDAAQATFFSDDKVKVEKYITQDSPKFYGRFEHVYSLHEGPYLLGEKISYADYIAYNIIVSDGRNREGKLDKYPNLERLYKAFEERPNVKEYIASIPKKPVLM